MSANETPLLDQLIQLFEDTGKAHHHAFIETDGADPEWAIWYAGYLHERLPELLGVKLTKSEIVYLLVRLSVEQPAHAPGLHWPRYYARYFVNQYT